MLRALALLLVGAAWSQQVGVPSSGSLPAHDHAIGRGGSPLRPAQQTSSRIAIDVDCLVAGTTDYINRPCQLWRGRGSPDPPYRPGLSLNIPGNNALVGVGGASYEPWVQFTAFGQIAPENAPAFADRQIGFGFVIGSTRAVHIDNRAREAIRVGISTWTPQYTLDVNGTIYTSSDVRVGGQIFGDGSQLTGLGESNTFVSSKTFTRAVELARTAGDFVLIGTNSVLQHGATFYSGNGRVGVGTSAPGSALHVSGDFFATGTGTVGSTLTVQGNAFSVGPSISISTFMVQGSNVAIGTAPHNMGSQSGRNARLSIAGNSPSGQADPLIALSNFGEAGYAIEAQVGETADPNSPRIRIGKFNAASISGGRVETTVSNTGMGFEVANQGFGGGGGARPSFLFRVQARPTSPAFVIQAPDNMAASVLQVMNESGVMIASMTPSGHLNISSMTAVNHVVAGGQGVFGGSVTVSGNAFSVGPSVSISTFMVQGSNVAIGTAPHNMGSQSGRNARLSIAGNSPSGQADPLIALSNFGEAGYAIEAQVGETADPNSPRIRIGKFNAASISGGRVETTVSNTGMGFEIANQGFGGGGGTRPSVLFRIEGRPTSPVFVIQFPDNMAASVLQIRNESGVMVSSMTPSGHLYVASMTAVNHVVAGDQGVFGGSVTVSGNALSVGVSTMVITNGEWGLPSYTRAQIDLRIPARCGAMIFCSNCATSGDVCVSTGTAGCGVRSAYRRIGTAAGCGSAE